MAKTYSTFAIAKMLNVDPGSVANWMDQGLLKSYRTPGGHRRASEDNLIRFLREHKIPIPEELEAAPPRVLVVDDDESVGKMISQAIHQGHPNYTTDQAKDGFAAGTAIVTQKPDVVILDLRMPGMDGYEVCKMIKSQEATRHIDVIAITAYPESESEKKILDCGARKCFSKPLDMEQLLKEIEACVE